MRNPRNLAWKVNWYRQSELEGALLLGKMLRHVRDPELMSRLTKHCADEARHAWIWERTRITLGLPAVQIRRSYQSFYTEETRPPASLAEVLGLTHIFEQRVHRQFSEELEQPDLPAALRRTFIILLRDEQGHLDWVARWLSTQPDGERAIQRYRDIDERVYQQLLPFRERIWDIRGLGEEIDACVPQ